MRIGLFGGSFDPVHGEHVRAAEAAEKALGLDKLVAVPSFVAPHKGGGAHASGEDRLAMCRIAFGKLACAETSDFELRSGGTSYTYLTCRHFAERYAGAELFFLVGADMLADFFTWKNPDDILLHATPAAFGREGAETDNLRGRFRARFQKDFVRVPFCGKAVSSTRLRVLLAFGKKPSEMDGDVLAYVGERGLYTHPAIAPALALEKEERREHSLRVALLSAERARSLGIREEKAVLAAALHDCGKYVRADSPLLAGFSPPEGTPAPVLHQYTGAYLAERAFGVTDREVLEAIRYHTTGKEDMTPLGKLIFTADMLEEGRDFEGIEALRKLFFRDLDACLVACLKRQIAYLAARGERADPLSMRALLWAEAHI